MQLSGDYTFDADVDTVWNVLMDPQAIATALPGVEALTPIEGETDAWKANARLKVAAITGAFSGEVRISEKNPPQSYRLTVQGDGQQSIINGTAIISLSAVEGAAKTKLHWEAEASVSGKIAGIGQRLVKAAATMLSKQFFKGLAKQLPASDIT